MTGPNLYDPCDFAFVLKSRLLEFITQRYHGSLDQIIIKSQMGGFS